jgi:hypothetical protein
MVGVHVDDGAVTVLLSDGCGMTDVVVPVTVGNDTGGHSVTVTVTVAVGGHEVTV